VKSPPGTRSAWLGPAAIGLGALVLLLVAGAALALALAPPAPALLPSPAFLLETPLASPTPELAATEPPPPTGEPPPLPTPHGFDFGTPTPAPRPILVTTVTAQPGVGEDPYLWNGSGSRLGLHVSRNSLPGIMQFVRDTHPTVMKGVDDVGFLGEVEQVSPATVTVGRFVVEQPNMGQGDPVARAEAFVQANLARYQANPDVDFWEGWNEPDSRQMDWYAQFEAHRACRMHELGFRAAIGGFSVGTPELDDFLRFLPAVRAAQQCGGILTLHEYGAPTFDLWFGSSLPGQPAYPNRGVLAFRYRWWYEDVLIPNGLAIPLVVSEAGVDGLVALGRREGPVGPGWLEFRNWWVSQGLTTDPDQFYLDQLAWYDGLAQQDSYMIGFTVYSAGGKDLPGQATYEIGSILPEITAYVRANR
jgi:hypothetical protein